MYIFLQLSSNQFWSFFGWLTGWLAGWLVGWLVGGLCNRLVGRLCGWLALVSFFAITLHKCQHRSV